MSRAKKSGYVGNVGPRHEANIQSVPRTPKALPHQLFKPAKTSLVSTPEMPRRHKYLLFTEALRHASGRSLWRFMLLATTGDQTVSASDLVEEKSVSRTELLALVRGLEAADAPANVRLFTTSGYIHRGLTRGIAQWRSQGWHWERFGRRVPIRDCDLWQRVEHALQFHQVDSRVWGETDHAAEQLSAEFMVELEATPAASLTTQKAPSFTAIPKRQPATRRRRTAYRDALGNLQQRVESLLSPGLMSAG